MKVYKFLAYLFSLGLFVSSLLVIIYRQEVIDWWRLRGYEPAAEIARISDTVSFSDEGRKLFYVHDPELLDKQNFQGKCNQNEETIVLGCYITNDRIYLFDVEDDRLEGVEEVTAAHEMLHAAYDRLSAADRDRIDALTQEVFESSSDERLQKTIEAYRKRDPSVVPNELHSILGTEHRNLPDELEDHYAQYFLDRSLVVAIAEAYEEEFTKRENQIKAYDKRLALLDAQIAEYQANADQLQAALEFERQQLDSKRGDPAAYNDGVPSYNAKVREFNAVVGSLRASINEFNDIVAKRNVLAVEEKELVEAIDTRLTEI